VSEERDNLLKDKGVRSLLTKIVDRYGYDFTDYSAASLRRRLSLIINSEHLGNIGELENLLLSDPKIFQRFVHQISVNVTSMFRDPSFYLTFRKQVVPLLATYPFIRVWHAGCATGEEVYSMAILLEEEGLYERSRIYATDMDSVSIQKAKQGIFPLSSMREYSSNYLAAGGTESLSKYYTADQEHALFRSHLRRNIVFAQHNLVCDGSFNEFHVVLCRNVMIYFNSELRDKVLSLLHDSLIRFGILGLGSKESIRFSSVQACYDQINDNEKLYKRII
jgi:MCP methyltransferase, CheR-type